jgi:hypothetical protein
MASPARFGRRILIGSRIAGEVAEAELAGSRAEVVVDSDVTRRAMRAANSGGASPSGNRAHCTSRNLSGTFSSSSLVSSMTTDRKNALLAMIKCERSTASFHSSRKYPSARAWVFREMIGTNSAQVLICLRID